MSIEIRTSLTRESERVIQDNAQRPSRVLRELKKAIGRAGGEIEGHLVNTQLRGGDVSKKRGGDLPLAVRSGSLLQSTFSRVVPGKLSFEVGAGKGTAARYAQTLLSGGVTTITPKNANHLWIPIADNVTKSGQTRMSPREAMSKTSPTGKRLLRIFKSKKGNMVAVLPEARQASRLSDRESVFAPTGGRFKRGKKKGLDKGKLLFVLKDSVQIRGTDGLRIAVEERLGRVRELLEQGLLRGLEGST